MRAVAEQVPFRSIANTEARRVALEELRMAHRLLLGIAPPTVRGALLDVLRAVALQWRLGDGSSSADDLNVARACVRRAVELAQLDGVTDVERQAIARIDNAYAPQLRPIVSSLFERIRASDAALRTIEPLGDA